MDRKIDAAAFKAQCLALIDEVAETGQPIIVTRRGKAKVQIVAVREKPKTLWGATKGTFEILGDIVGPTIEDHDDLLERKRRRINGQLDDPPARYTHRRLADGATAKPRKGGKAHLQSRPRKNEIAISAISYYELGLQLQKWWVVPSHGVAAAHHRFWTAGISRFDRSCPAGIGPRQPDGRSDRPLDRCHGAGRGRNIDDGRWLAACLAGRSAPAGCAALGIGECCRSKA